MSAQKKKPNLNLDGELEGVRHKYASKRKSSKNIVFNQFSMLDENNFSQDGRGLRSIKVGKLVQSAAKMKREKRGFNPDILGYQTSRNCATIDSKQYYSNLKNSEGFKRSITFTKAPLGNNVDNRNSF